MFVCTHIEKLVSEDNYETGESLETTCTMSNRTDISGATLTALLSAVGDYLGLTIDSVWSGNVESGVLEYSRQENAAGDEPTARELAKFQSGEINLYSARYSFLVVWREERDITVSDLSGVNHYE